MWFDLFDRWRRRDPVREFITAFDRMIVLEDQVDVLRAYLRREILSPEEVAAWLEKLPLEACPNVAARFEKLLQQ